MLKSKLPYVVIAFCLLLSQSACWYSDSLTSRLAQANYEATQAHVDAQTAIQGLQDMEKTKEGKIKYAGWAMRVGTVTDAHRNFTNRLNLCVDPNSGKLIASASDVRALKQLLSALTETANDVLRDPEIFKLSATNRTTITGFIGSIPDLAGAMIEVLNQIKPKSNTAPPLNIQLKQRVAAQIKGSDDKLSEAHKIMADTIMAGGMQ